MNIQNAFSIGETVYLVTDKDQQKRMVIGIYVRKNGLTYELSCGQEISYHYDFEMSAKEDVVLKTNN